MEDTKNTKTLLSILQKKKYACKYCGKSYTESYSRKRHMTNRHHKMMSTAENTESEIQSHCTKKEYICDNCDLIYDDDDSFESHMLGVHNFQKNEITYDCSNCYESFSEKVDYEKHLKKINKKINKKIKANKIHIHTVHEGHKDHKCKSCGKSFSHAGNLKRHIYTIHESQKPKISKKRGKFICEYCQKFVYKKRLKKHLKDCEVHKEQRLEDSQKIIKCHMCEKSFENNYRYAIHRDLVHQRLNELLCQFCGNDFRSRKMIKRHINLVHKNLKNYKCEACGEGKNFVKLISRKKIFICRYTAGQKI